MEHLTQPIKTYDDYTTFVVALATQLELFAYEVHAHIHELGTETVPYFRLMWSTEHAAPFISIHVGTANVEAIQFYSAAKNLCPNIYLSESYYTSFEGETFIGADAEIANQMDAEASTMETTTQALVGQEDDENPPIFIANTPIYHAEDPKAAEQAKALKKRKGYGRFP